MVKALSAAELLGLWERGLAQSQSRWALSALSSVGPHSSRNAAAPLSVGQRNARLLTLREQAFGSRLTSMTVCPECEEQLELDFDLADVRVETHKEPKEQYSFDTGEYEIHYRLPTGRDLVSLEGQADSRKADSALLERCVLKTVRNGEAVDVGELPEEVVDAVSKGMEEADPQANMQLKVECPACQYRWQVTFDIVSFFWNELDVWAQRLLYAVHTLSASYGWSESDILAMSAYRRQVYLEMSGG